MKHMRIIGIAGLAAGILLAGCSSATMTGTSLGSREVTASAVLGTATLYAGQTNPLADVTLTLSEDGASLNVALGEIAPEWADWTIAEAHIAVADSAAQILGKKKGNPSPGQFANVIAGAGPYDVPVVDADGDGAVVVAIHLELTKTVPVLDDLGQPLLDELGNPLTETLTESAWAAGDPAELFDGNNWATYLTLALPVEEPVIEPTP